MPLRAALALMLLLFTAAAGATVGLGPAPQVEGGPGEYVTFAVPLSAEGVVTLSIDTPAGWTLVSATRTLTLSGEMLVPFTLRIPSSALLGTTAELLATATTAAGASSETGITVTVIGSTGTSLAEPAELSVAPGEILSFTVTVTNDANQPDTILLSASNASRRVLVSPERLELGPFQTGEATITVPVQGTVNDGYRFLIELRAWSRIADAETVRQIRATYSSGSSGIPLEQRNPQLTLSITTAASAGVESTGGESEPFFNWSVTPGLSGELSDFVNLDIRSGPFGNTHDSAFSVPRHTDILLRAETWDAALNLSPGQVRLSGSLQAADWRFSVSGHRMRVAGDSYFGLGLGASSLNPDLDLQFSGNLLLAEGLHSESLSVLYRRQLSASLGMGVGLGLVGTGRSDVDDYHLYASFSQSLNWLSQGFSLTQSVSSTPGLGLTNLSLIGGSRSTHPLGIRFMSRLAFRPGSSRLTNAVQLISTPVSWLRLNAGVAHQTTDFGAGPGVVRLQFGVAWQFRSSVGLNATLRLDSETSRALDEHSQSGQRFRVGFSSSVGRLALALGLTSERLAASLSESASSSLFLDASAILTFAEGSSLEARLDMERSERDQYRFSVRWRQRWSAHLDSDLAFGFSNGGQDLSVGLSARDVFTNGLRFGIGYGLELGGDSVTHRFSAGVSYTWRIPFRTPRPVVQLFGGRETGSLSGTAFIDTNRNLLRDAGEEHLSGLIVGAGEFSTVTGADGRFTLRLPAGQHTLTFGGNLPATLGFSGDSQVMISLGAEQPLDLPFAAVSVMQVSVFLDGDRDGTRSAGEPLLPGSVLQLSGPLDRRIVTGAEGSSWVTGLIEGNYNVHVDFGSLPAGFELTQAVAAVSVRPPENPAPLLIPVAPLIRDVVTTFAAGNLAVTAAVSQSTVRPGAELRVSANLQGEVTGVTVELFGQRVAMEQNGTRWEAVFTVPDAPGLIQGFVEATSGQDSVRAQIQVLVLESD